MSIIDSSHIVAAKRGRHGARYKLLPRGNDKKSPLVPSMIMYRDKESMPFERNEPICSNCFYNPWSLETKVCPRCGGKIE